MLNDGDKQTYVLLLENLRRDLNPGDALEEILVEKIAMAYWRLHIAYGYEADFARSRSEFIVVAERMGRYANTIHRQLLQAMNEFERLQRRRSGEAVPAPINVDLTVNHLEEELMDTLPRLHDSGQPLGLSIPASGRLIENGASDPASQSRPVFSSNDEALQFCETNPTIDTSRVPDQS